MGAEGFNHNPGVEGLTGETISPKGETFRMLQGVRPASRDEGAVNWLVGKEAERLANEQIGRKRPNMSTHPENDPKL